MRISGVSPGIHLKGLLSQGPPSPWSPWNFLALPFWSSGLEAGDLWVTSWDCAHLPDQVGGQTELKSKRGFPTLSGQQLLQSRRAASFPENLGAYWFPYCCSFCHRVAWVWGRQEKTEQKERIGNFPHSPWASTVFFLAPWPEGFSWRAPCPALRTTCVFQVSMSSGWGTWRGKWQSQAISAVLWILPVFFSASATICFPESSDSWCLHSTQAWQPSPLPNLKAGSDFGI